MTFFEGSTEGACILSLSYDIISDFERSTGEGRIGLLRDVAEALVDHRRDDGVDVVLERPHNGGTYVTRGDVTLVGDDEGVLCSFLVGDDTDDGLVVVLYGDVDTLSSVHWRGDICEDLLELRLYIVDVYVTDDDDRLEVGAVPLLVVVTQHLIGEVADDVHLPDGEALAVLVAREGHTEELLRVSHISVVAAAPFFFDDSTLSVDFLVFEADEATPVVEDEDTAVDDAATWYGDLHQRIDRAVKAGISVDVTTEARPDTFEEVDNPLAREVLGAVEGNVLEEVCEPLLGVFFLHRAYLLGDVKFCAALGLFIMSDEVGESVGELANAYGGVYGKRWHRAWSLRLERRRKSQCCTYEERRKEGENGFLEPHRFLWFR